MKRVNLFIFLVLSLCFSVFVAFGEKADAADMHRLYNPNSGEHFYTATGGEKEHLVKVGWKYEGIGWTAPSNGNAVYRLYNANAGDHHYTLNVGEKDHLVKVGWKYEDIGWYSDTKKAVPLYRAYNPNAKAGSHNYTVNYAEQKNLIRVGWRDEGIVWYGINKTTPVTKYTVTVKHVGSDGKTLKTATASVEKGKSYTAKAGSFSGYKLKGGNSQTVTVNGNKTVTFNYTKNAVTPTKYTVAVKHLGSDGKELKKSTTTVEKGKSYTAKSESFSGYTLKGNSSQTVTVDGNKTITFNYTKNTTPVTNYKVTIRHVGSDQKELKKTIVEVEKGKSHTAKAESFTGYTLSGKDSQTISGVNADQTITFNYNLNKYNVTVVHKGSNGKTLETEKTVSVDYGKEHTAKSKTFTGYTLSGGTSQKVTIKGTTTITFTYNPIKYNVTVVHKGSNGKTLETEKAVSVDYDKEHTANSKTFTGYTLSGGTSQKVTVKGTTTVTFTYNPNKCNVTVVHKGSNGKTLETEKAVTVDYDKEHTANSKTFTGYTLFGAASQKITVKGTTTITFTYNPNKYNVTVVHKSSDGTVLETEKAVSVEYDQEYIAKSKTFYGHTVSGNATQKITIKNNQIVTFNYTRAAGIYRVTIVHKGSDGTTLATDPIRWVNDGVSYNVDAKEFPGYTLSGKFTQVVNITKDTTITFNYTKNGTPATKYKVTVKHVGSDGKDLKTASEDIEKGKTYIAKAETFTGYTLKGNSSQTVTVDGNKTITFNYTLNKYNVTVVHKGSDGATLETEKAVSVDHGKTHTANSKTFPGYTLSGAKTQTVTVKGHTTITFNYTKNAVPVDKYNVTVVHKGNDGSVLETEAAVAVESGKKHTATAKSFTGYKLVGSNAQTVTVTGNMTITFDYASLAFDTVKMNVYLDKVYQKTVTKLVPKGEKFIPSSDKLGLDPNEYDLVYTIKWPEMTAVGGETRTYSFYMSPFKHYLSESELIIMQQTIIQKVNELRVKEGVSPLQENPKLKAAAAVRAKELKTYFSHTRPDGRDYQTALTEQGLTCQAGENIAGVGDPTELVSGKAAGEAMFKLWENSPGHRENMVGSNYKFIGMDLYCYGSMVYGTQLFTDVIK